MRLFISIDLPVDVRRQICERLEAVHSAELKPVSGDQLHITLAFLGTQPLNELERIEQALASLAIPRLTIHCGGVHSFRSGAIWLAVKPTPELLRFQKQLCRLLMQTGVKLESRRYIPHITLLRSKGPVSAQQQQQLNALFGDLTPAFDVDAIWLKESQLHSDGARHQVIAGFH